MARMIFFPPRFKVMPALLPRLFFLISCLMLCHCQSGSQYVITLKDGREYVSNGIPQYQRKTGYYRYRTPEDRDALLRADEVLAIEEQDS